MKDRKLPSWVLSLIILAIWVVLANVPMWGYDWIGFFEPATQNLNDPYKIPGVANPPWTFILLWPFAQLPGQWGLASMLTVSLLLMVRILGQPANILAAFLSIPTIALFYLGQIDGLLLLATMLPPCLSWTILVCKPQGVFLAGLHRGGLRGALVLGATFLTSCLLWGWWPGRVGAVHQTLNLAWWPWLVPLGVILAFVGIRKRSQALLCLATLCVMPYHQPHSWVPFTVFAIKERRRPWLTSAAISALVVVRIMAKLMRC